jgi:hypothetical protein
MSSEFTNYKLDIRAIRHSTVFLFSIYETYGFLVYVVRTHGQHKFSERRGTIVCCERILWHVDTLLGNALINTFPCRWILGNQLVAERFLGYEKKRRFHRDSWKPTFYRTRFLGYEQERYFHRDRILETKSSLWNQQIFPLIRISNTRWEKNWVQASRRQARREVSLVQSRTERNQNGASHSPVRIVWTLGSHLVLVIVTDCDWEWF